MTMTLTPVFRRAGARRGFTMIEIMLVVMIIMVLIGLVGPKLIGKSKKANIDATKIAMHNVKTALEQFEMNAQRFPSTSEGLEGLVKRPSDVPESQWQPYMESMPRDAWGYEFKYVHPSEHGKDYDLISGGPDHKLGTDDDITNYGEDTVPKKLGG